MSTIIPFLGDDGSYDRDRREAEARNEYARRKVEAEEHARQDLIKKCEYISEDIAEELVNNIRTNVDKIIDDLENNFRNELHKNKAISGKRSDDLHKISTIRNEITSLLLQTSM